MEDDFIDILKSFYKKGTELQYKKQRRKERKQWDHIFGSTAKVELALMASTTILISAITMGTVSQMDAASILTVFTTPDLVAFPTPASFVVSVSLAVVLVLASLAATASFVAPASAPSVTFVALTTLPSSALAFSISMTKPLQLFWPHSLLPPDPRAP